MPSNCCATIPSSISPSTTRARSPFCACSKRFRRATGRASKASASSDPAAMCEPQSGPRIRDLDAIPSPFLDGVFDPLIASNPDETWIGLWETNRGCPFKCTFCDWGSATANKVNQFGLERHKGRSPLVRATQDRLRILLRREFRHSQARLGDRRIRRRDETDDRISRRRFRCRTPRTPPSAPTRRKKCCRIPASTRA